MFDTRRKRGYAYPVAHIGGNGFGDPYSSGAEASRRQVRGFFYALTFLVGGVWGGREACRTQSPVRQPDISSTALSLATPFGGLKLLLWSYTMNTQDQGAIAPINFVFENHQLQAIVDEHGEPWFIAMHVAEILEYTDAEAMTRKLDDDEVQNLQIVGFGNRGVNLINESGLYSAILTSKKPAAKKIKKWVTSEVLPSIRKTGGYQTTGNQYAVEHISNAQYHELKHLVWMIGNNFHQTGGGTFAAWRVLRKELGCEVAAKLPAEHFDTAKARLEALEKQCFAFKGTIMDTESKFMTSLFKTEPDWAALEQDAKRLGLG